MENSRFADVNGEFTLTAADNTGYSLVFYCGTIGIVNTFGSVLAEFDADDIPAADVVHGVHGKWETDKEDIEWGNSMKKKYCSVCGKRPWYDRTDREFVLTPFCPNCGAKMDGGKKG